jgi:hypothetical protein
MTYENRSQNILNNSSHEANYRESDGIKSHRDQRNFMQKPPLQLIEWFIRIHQRLWMTGKVNEEDVA